LQARDKEEESKKVAKSALGGAAQGARTARKASKKVAQGALGGAAQGAHTLPQASLSVAERGLGGAALRVQEPPSSWSELPLHCFPVPCMNNSMYGKKMRHVHLAGFVVESDEIIRFRKSDDKAVQADILKATGRFGTVREAQRAILKLIESKSDKISDLTSMDLDKNLVDSNGKVCFKFFQI